MLWIIGVLAVIILLAVWVIRSKLQDADDDY